LTPTPAGGDLVLTGCRIFTGDEVLTDRSVVVRDGVVVGLPSTRDTPLAVGAVDLGGRWVSPGFIDLQVNGGGDVLFNDDPTVAAIERIVDAHRRLGTTDVLLTFVTAPVPAMVRAGEAVREAIAQQVDGVLGIHFEGPLINPARAGAHDAGLARTTPDDEVLAALTAPTGGATLVTLAPEVVPPGFVETLVDHGIKVAAGHTDATADEVARAADEGLDAATHVWNVMRPPTAREPGTVGAVLADPRIRCGLIADGHHVSWPTLQVSLRALGARRAFLVTDAMPPLGGTATSFRLGGHRVEVHGDRCTTDDGRLAGSMLDLASAVRNVVRHAGVPIEDALRMVTRTPAEALGVADRRGRVAAGRPARLTIFDDDLHVSAVVVDGALTDV
jgi:N-acetylglucosamine-6-phosphate deacetylase